GAFFVDLPIELLEVGQVGAEEVLDDARRDGSQRAQLHDHTRQEDDDQEGPVGLDAVVLQGCDLVLCSGEAHDPFTMKVAVLVDIAFGQCERKLGLKRHETLPLWRMGIAVVGVIAPGSGENTVCLAEIGSKTKSGLTLYRVRPLCLAGLTADQAICMSSTTKTISSVTTSLPLPSKPLTFHCFGQHP